MEDRFYRPSSSLAPFIPCLRCDFLIRPVADAKEAVQRIEARTKIRLSESQARRWMKGQGMALRKACPIPGKVDPQLQLVFYTEKLLPKLEQARDDKQKRCLTNKHYRDFDAFCAAIDLCLDQVSGPFKKEIQTLMSPKFQFFKLHKS